jgi:hypothetical protein
MSRKVGKPPCAAPKVVDKRRVGSAVGLEVLKATAYWLSLQD